MSRRGARPSGGGADDQRRARRLPGRSGAGGFAEIYATHAVPLERSVYRIVGDRETARDITHDTLLKALELGRRVEADVIGPWLYTVAHNGALDHLRRARRTQVEGPAAIDRRRDTQPWPVWGSTEPIHGALERLSTLQRQVMTLRYALGLHPEEAGAVLERSADSIRHIESRALQALRSRLEA